jgi:1,2-diacylglycerol 3-beta-galactosyltransferase
MQAMIRVAHPQLVARLRRHWRPSAPDMVVSLVPNFNRAIGESVARTCAGTTFVTLMTDLADLPPHFWVEPGCTEHLICGTDRAVGQALAQGVSPLNVHRVSGMLLRPAFYTPPVDNRDTARLALGFEPDSPVGVVMFGGEGSRAMTRIATDLDDLPLILLCGRNEKLARRLANLPARAPRPVVDYTDDVARWMRLGDWFVGKPGPGSLSEALHCGLPVITVRNAWTMPQERWNTDWLREQSLGLVLPSLAQLRTGVEALLQRLPEWRASVRRLDNRALFEVPEILGWIAAGRATEKAQAMQAQRVPASVRGAPRTR